MRDRKPDKCVLCGARNSEFRIAGEFVYGGDGSQKFYDCPGCGVAFLHPVLSKAEEKKFYAEEFEKFMEKRAGRDFDWSGPEAHIKSNYKQFLRRQRFFKDLISPDKSVLEIGCSSGFMLFPLKDKGLSVTGVEPSSVFSNFLKNRKIPVFASLDSLRKSKYGRNRYDLVMHFFVLEHVRDPIAFLKEALGFVSSGGKMIFEVPNRDDPLISIYNIPTFQKFYWSVAHNYYFNRRSLEFVLDRVGAKFEICNEQRYDISNHLNWALEGKPGGQGKYSAFFTPELEKAYLRSMIETGFCDTLIAKVYKG